MKIRNKILIALSFILVVAIGVIGLMLYMNKDQWFAESQLYPEDEIDNEVNEDDESVAPAASTSTLILNKTSATICNTETLQLKITAGNDSKKTVTWTSSNPGVASVDSKGNVKGIVAGKTTITATVGKKSVTCEIKVEKDQMHFIDLGFGGNSILLESNNKYVLIDAGDIDSDKHTDAKYIGFGKNNIDTYFTKVKYLENNKQKTGLKKLDALVISHMHYDHAAAAVHVIQTYKPTALYIKNYTKNSVSYFKDIIDAAKKAGTKIVYPTEGQTVTYGNYTLKFYNTKESLLKSSTGQKHSDNINSLVIMASLKKKNKTYLSYIPGDIENDGGVSTKNISNQIAKDYNNQPIDVYVAAHHGYYDDDGLSPDLKAVNNNDEAIKPLKIKNAIVPNTMGWLCNKKDDRKYIGILNIYKNLKKYGDSTKIYFSNASRVKITFTNSNLVIDGGEVLKCTDKNCANEKLIHEAIKAQVKSSGKTCDNKPY